MLVGTSLLESDFFGNMEQRAVLTQWEKVAVHRSDDLVVRQRHASPEGYRPPHRINHRANLRALEQLGVTSILSIQSVGSLKASIEPGSFVVPHDFINPWEPVTVFDDERGHGVSTFSDPMRERILAHLDQEDVPHQTEGVYFQTPGPRFETPAEATMLADYGDVVGMTAGSEVTLACELEMDYATLCSVDNYVNGIEGETIDMQSFQSAVRDHLPVVQETLRSLLKNAFNLDFPGGVR